MTTYDPEEEYYKIQSFLDVYNSPEQLSGKGVWDVVKKGLAVLAGPAGWAYLAHKAGEEKGRAESQQITPYGLPPGMSLEIPSNIPPPLPPPPSIPGMPYYDPEMPAYNPFETEEETTPTPIKKHISKF